MLLYVQYDNFDDDNFEIIDQSRGMAMSPFLQPFII